MPSNLNFDATQVAPSTAFEPIPAGQYRAHITASEMKPTARNPNNEYLELEWTILDGPQKGRRLWSRLNIRNDNATAQEIAQRDLSAICHHVGRTKMRSSAELHHSPALITVLIKPRKDTGEMRSEVVGYDADPANPRAIPLPKHGSTTFGQGAAQQVQQGAQGQRPVAPAMGPSWNAPRSA